MSCKHASVLNCSHSGPWKVDALIFILQRKKLRLRLTILLKVSSWQLAEADLTGSCICSKSVLSSQIQERKGWAFRCVYRGARFLDLCPVYCHLASQSLSFLTRKMEAEVPFAWDVL